MHLITMAHLGEAQALIDEFELKKISPHHFENGQLILLITGEGPFEAASLTSYFLGKRDVKQIINLGIAGSLNDKMSIGEIYSIRSLYLAIDGKPQFKSFKLAEEGVDAITSFERILRPEKARPLSAIAQIVDREAWGVALSAKNFSIPFECAKLISDRAGEIGACELIREEAYSYSQKLSAYLKNKIDSHVSPEPIDIDLAGFHFTFSMGHHFKGLLQKISLRDGVSQEDILDLLPLEDLRSQKLRPKDRSSRLIEMLELKLDPLKEKLQAGIASWKSPYEKQGLILQTDPTWENPSVKVSFEIESNQDLKVKMNQLSELDLSPFHQLRNGSFNVE
jgi:Phosphorylase superfamily